MKEPGKGIKIVFGPVHPLVNENDRDEIIEIPSEKAGEKKIITKQQLQQIENEFLELQANTHYIEQNASDKIMKRIAAETGKVLSETRNTDEKTTKSHKKESTGGREEI